MKEEAKYFFVASAIDDKTWDSFVTRESSAKLLKQKKFSCETCSRVG